MKKTLVFALCLILALSLVACSAPATTQKSAAPAAEGTPAAAKPIKIGLIFPLSGKNADQGVFNVDGAKLAVEEINAAGGIASLGGAKLDLVVYDNESDSDKSKTVAERLINENPDVVAIHGASASAYVLPMLSVFEKGKVPFLTAQTSQTITSQGYKYAFAFAAQSPQFAQTQVDMLEWLNKEYSTKITKVGIVYEDTEWGLTNSAAARKSIEASETLELVYDQSYTASSADLSSIVVGLMNSGAEVVFPTSYTQDAKLLFNTMVSNKYSPLIIGGGAGFLYPVFADDLGDLVDGVISVSSHSYDAAVIRNSKKYSDVGERFEKAYKYFMPEQGVSAYNAVYLVSQALEKTASTDREAVMNAVRGLKITSLTPGGELNFQENGWNENGTAVMVQWQKDADGVYRPHTVFPASEATVKFQLTDLLKSKLAK
ncbi:MAG: ABC transporter substrate-binding protein [Bacillota bacterium]